MNLLKLILSAAMHAFGALAPHDTTGKLADPNASLTEKAEALIPAAEAAGSDIIEKGLIEKLGPEGALVEDMVAPLLKQAIATANAKLAAFAQPIVAKAESVAEPIVEEGKALVDGAH